MNAGDEQFHLLVDAVRDYAIFMLDPTGVVVSWNPGAERIKQYLPNEIIGQHFRLFYTDEDQQAGVPERALQTALREGRYKGEGVRVRKDRSRFFADVLITPVYGKEGTGLVGFAKVTRDVTERHRFEEHLRGRIDELAEADKRKDEFIAMLAHELRNPLAPIMTGLSIVQRLATYPPRGERAMRTMDRQLRLMARMVDDLLQVSRLTRGKIDLRREMQCMDVLLQDAVDTVQHHIDARMQKLEVDCEEGLELYCDGQRLVQVLSNVIHNASKYTDEGGWIRVHARAEGQSCRVVVQDSGVGIRSEMLDHIFDLFTQDQSPLGTGMQGGLGIGLALARTVVAMHGGRITASSEGPNQGATFEITLPLLSVGDHEEAFGGAGKQVRILVVDDNRDAAEMVSDLLEVEGYTVERAFGGVEALRKAEEFHPHMILLDLLMPDLTGYEVVKRVRLNPGGPVVVAVTGHGSDSDREAVRRAGFDEHIIKPIAGDSILAVVRRFMGKPGSSGAGGPEAGPPSGQLIRG